LSEASRFALIGIVLGIAICVIVTAAMTDQLYGVSPHDPLTYAVVVAILVATVLLAAIIPGVRASAVQPATALHYE
jgi:ABC-type antimicrobial peptide transport system permease subunit